MAQLSRRALLTGAGAGAGAVALLGSSPAPSLAAPAEADLANVRLVCSTKRLMITCYTRWIDAPKAVGSSADATILRAVRRQEQAHYALLAPLLGASAPVDDDFTVAIPGGALRSPALAATFGLALERLATGIAIGAASRVADTGVAGSLTSIVACEGQHLGALSALAGGSPVPTALPRGLDIVDASNQLAPFLAD
jgi:Ferritin-like domain